MIGRFPTIWAAVDLAGPINLTIPAAIKLIAQAKAPSGKMLAEMGPLIVYIACIYKGSRFKTGNACFPTEFSTAQIAGISIAVVIAIGPHAIDAAQIELFTAVKGTVGQLSLETKTKVPRPIIPDLKEAPRQFMVSPVIVGTAIGSNVTAPINEIVLKEFIRCILASADAGMPYTGPFFSS